MAKYKVLTSIAQITIDHSELYKLKKRSGLKRVINHLRAAGFNEEMIADILKDYKARTGKITKDSKIHYSSVERGM